MSPKKKVLFFIQSGVGGAERVTINIAKMLPSSEFEVSYVVIGNKNNIYNFLPKDKQIYRIKIKDIRFWGLLRIMRIIKSSNADIVFSSIMYINVRVLVACKICGVKSIIRNNNSIDAVSNRIKFLMKLTYPLANKIIAQQEEMRDEIISELDIPSTKVVSLHNPIDFNDIRNKSFEKNPYNEESLQSKFLCVARFNRNKGQDILIQAFKHVLGKITNAHLYFLGKYEDGEDTYEFVKRYIEKEKITDRVHFEGIDNNPYRWMKNCDCYVMPSRLEGLPNALIEAMFLGKPVVGTLCVPIVERIIKDGYNGYIVDVENPEKLADRMIKALCLNNFKMTYNPSSAKDFISIFNI